MNFSNPSLKKSLKQFNLFFLVYLASPDRPLQHINTGLIYGIILVQDFVWWPMEVKVKQ